MTTEDAIQAIKDALPDHRLIWTDNASYFWIDEHAIARSNDAFIFLAQLLEDAGRVAVDRYQLEREGIEVDWQTR